MTAPMTLQQAFDKAQMEKARHEAKTVFTGMSETKREELVSLVSRDIHNTKAQLAEVATRANSVHPRLLAEAPVDTETGRISRRYSPPSGYQKVFNSLAQEWENHYETLRRLRSQLEVLSQ